MLLDLQNILSDDQDLAQAAGTYVSTHTIDLGVAGTTPAGFQARGSAPHDIGAGAVPELLMQVTQTFTSGGAGTLRFDLIMSANADLSSPTILASTQAIALATLVAGYLARLAIPAGITARYLGAQYVVATATMTAGKCTTGLLLNRQTNYGL